jgi:hypothetical protein
MNSKFMFCFWIGMILLSIALGWVNFMIGSMLMFSINVLTVVLAGFNAYNVAKTINK